MARNKNTATPVTDEVVEVETTEEVTFSAKEVATELGLDPKSFRRWLRAHTAERANKGGRWIFTTAGKEAIVAAYNAKKTDDPEPDTEG